jgi:hypothetical protein
MMKAKRAELEGEGKKLVFVGGSGDNVRDRYALDTTVLTCRVRSSAVLLDWYTTACHSRRLQATALAACQPSLSPRRHARRSSAYARLS